VLCAADRAGALAPHIDILAAVQAIGPSALVEMPSLTTFEATVRAAREAYAAAGITPRDVDVVELHDCFTMAEIVDSEDLGLFEKGKGGPAVADGETQVDGRIPINPSGGLLAKGHPVGATGLGQVYELVQQLRGRLELLVLEQPPNQRLPRILHRLIALGGIRPRKQHPGLDVDQRGGHDQELADGVEVELLHQLYIFEILLSNQGDRNIVDVHLVLLNEVNQQIQRPLERLELDGIRVRRRFKVRRCCVFGHQSSVLHNHRSVRL